MKPIAAFLLLLVIGVLPSSSAFAADAKQPELALLETLAGEYEYEFTEEGATTPGVISLQPFPAGHYLILDEIGQLGTGEPLGIKGSIGYEVSSERFTWYRVFSHGAWDRGVGR